MIDLEEELKKFKPSLDIGSIEDAVLEEEENDMVDLMIELVGDYRSNP